MQYSFESERHFLPIQIPEVDKSFYKSFNRKWSKYTLIFNLKEYHFSGEIFYKDKVASVEDAVFLGTVLGIKIISDILLFLSYPVEYDKCY